MIIHTHFNLGDKVLRIGNEYVPVWKLCPACTDGRVPTKDGKDLTCPVCEGKGLLVERNAHRWRVMGDWLTVGQIQLQVGGHDRGTDGDDEERYMMWQTGVGSGSVYYLRDLFRTIELAQAECDKRNDTTASFYCVRCCPQYEPVQFSKTHCWRQCPIHRHANHVECTAADFLMAERNERLEKERLEKEGI